MTGWWFQTFFIFTPKIGEMIQFDSYFSKGLKPPTSCSFLFFVGFVISFFLSQSVFFYLGPDFGG